MFYLIPRMLRTSDFIRLLVLKKVFNFYYFKNISKRYRDHFTCHLIKTIVGMLRLQLPNVIWQSSETIMRHTRGYHHKKPSPTWCKQPFSHKVDIHSFSGLAVSKNIFHFIRPPYECWSAVENISFITFLESMPWVHGTVMCARGPLMVWAISRRLLSLCPVLLSWRNNHVDVVSRLQR